MDIFEDVDPNPKKRKNKENYYIKEADLKAELIKYHATAANDEDKTPSEELGAMILLITERIANMACYAGYTFSDEMKSYATFRMLKSLKNIHPSKNILAYLTMCTKHSFHQIVKKEKKQSIIKDELMVNYVDEVGLDDMSDRDGLN
jgi:hypothetical protein